MSPKRFLGKLRFFEPPIAFVTTKKAWVELTPKKHERQITLLLPFSTVKPTPRPLLRTLLRTLPQNPSQNPSQNSSWNAVLRYEPFNSRVAQEPNRNRKPEQSEPFFPKPKAEPEPPEPFSRNRNPNRNRPFLLNLYCNTGKPFCRGTAGTENRNRSNRSTTEP